ncbi:YtxH domain-containing protein [Cecembia rubra]|uniref:Gas vesicle protein n=1 Tax=Cecembia rubra TaxID=1485585 RepID=A0A2P8ED97_9BACT|nr:YtxH domain-containing protein [Cecembia rubra]PSL07452.1 gas vesicle protein [Cecembia rubra]
MNATKFILGALVGAAVGIQIGILVAPDKGENTRKKITKKGGEYMDDLSVRLNGFFDNMTKKVSDVSDEVDKLAKKAKAEVNKVTH